MSRYVLDTDILTLYQENHPVVHRNVAGHLPTDLAIAVISVEEQLAGWYNQLRHALPPDALARVYQRLTNNIKALARLEILSFTEPAILRYEQLKNLKLNVKKMDLRIASIALEHGAILVTRNLRDFQRVPGLVLEDWSR
jgi:tRNA(fMet)-specific endonuclease VapC